MSSEEKARNCTYMDVLNFLNLTKDNELYTMSRPTLNYKDKTKIYLDVMIYAILDVRQSDQTLITYIWIDMGWDNPHLVWNETDFCGISVFSVPTEALWKPDLTIEEMTERDKAPPTPFLRVYSLGFVEYRNDQVVTSTCRMHVYRFPFDVQNCNLSFKSVVHSDEELEIKYFDNNTALTAWSRVIMENQYEWLFEKQSGTNKTVDYFGFNQTVIVFTITMKRRSSFYVANFLLPVLFFLCLDLSSLLMSEGGDKISFKVTVLLAVTVMQLILNEILPVSSDRTPLVVIYCIGIFALMLLSLMETILVKCLMEKDSASQDRDSVKESRMMEERGGNQSKTQFYCCFTDKTRYHTVKEIDQTFVPYVWIILAWQNDYISWDPMDFCGIDYVAIPTDILWKPDLTIEEMTEKDKAPPSPHLTIRSDGKVLVQNDQVLVSTCRMQVYKFPFDIQSCNLSVKSVVHSVKEIKLNHHLNSSVSTNWSRQLMRTQYEWLFVNMTITAQIATQFGIEQDVIIYTIFMKRRAKLYIINFLLPILFLLCLDLISFLIPDRGGEKLSFKVTVLLAVTVMQLILNDILPSSSDKTPLIEAYCFGIFALMMLSLLETILMMYLMDRESECLNGETDRARSGSVSELTGEQASEKFSGELKEFVKTVTLLLRNMKEEEKPGFWTRNSHTVNLIYFIFYVTAASLFLGYIYYCWFHAEE
ncbi:5-hydroxytryptamine receptor 3B [Austrofundulus limnaeus]|uniref:5-hydroxytryptamine receptor 3B n=1 Tax=Austrofundulus limnaeus TaxID=52670 RepID=A0A2I4B3V4_AUSLI|nr:PREDICTED: 5-hydroxytryptamine receptor 3B-like [Austrofundulus limnaeus]